VWPGDGAQRLNRSLTKSTPADGPAFVLLQTHVPIAGSVD